MEPSPVKILHHIDHPTAWASSSRCVRVRGWCFVTNGKTLSGVRLRSGGLLFVGSVGLPRPDVSAAIASAPDANVGFEVCGVLPCGPNDLVLEAQLSDGTWHPFVTQTITARRHWLPLWLNGKNVVELMSFQFPTLMQFAPRPLRPETFPATRHSDAPPPKLSIVTPSFQQARYLPATLRSVIEQPATFPFDYVVQDGGSTDGSTEIIRQHAKSGRLTTWESGPDQGQSDAIARGFAKTSGGPDDLMAWINSDDFYLPGALAFVVDYFARHPEVDAVYGHRILVDEESREIGRWFLPAHDAEVLRLNDFIPQETLFWRRRLWDKVGGIDPSFQFAMDWDLLLRFQAAGARIVRVPYFLACFRLHSAQKTSAAMRTTGQPELDRLRERSYGRPFPPQELENSPHLLRYLRRSAWIEFLWKRGIRAR